VSPFTDWPTEADWQIHVTEDALSSELLAELTRPKITKREDFEWVGAIEVLATKSIKDFDSRRHKLVGWVHDIRADEFFPEHKLRIVYEDNIFLNRSARPLHKRAFYHCSEYDTLRNLSHSIRKSCQQ
jgi:hypothetical protein